MVNELESFLSNNIRGMKRSAIREILKLTQRPEIISFAGGLPDPTLFPTEELAQVTNDVLINEGSMALQYGTTEGDPLLRKLLVERYQKQGITIEEKNLIITTASQQGLDLVSKIFINPGDTVICGLPSYLGALSAFLSYGANLEGVLLDEHGMRSDLLEAKIIELQSKGVHPKFIYTIPDFQNPTGITMPEWRRSEIVAVAEKYNVIILEDSPYREVRFAGVPQKTMLELDKSGRVIQLGTFSKVFVPGFRIGWAVANEEIIDKIVVAKQATDLCTPAFVQRISARFIEKGYFDKNLEIIIAAYKQKQEHFISCLEKYMPKEVSWTNPEGGLFIFLTLPNYMDATEFFQTAIEQKVAYVPGTTFYYNGEGKNTMRLNFSYMSLEKNEEGIKRLAKAISIEINAKQATPTY
jgi:2-aminoadipate transaminase